MISFSAPCMKERRSLLNIDAKGRGMRRRGGAGGGLGQAGRGSCVCRSPALLRPGTGCPPPCCSRGREIRQLLVMLAAQASARCCCLARPAPAASRRAATATRHCAPAVVHRLLRILRLEHPAVGAV
jgi:hypothetical protein